MSKIVRYHGVASHAAEAPQQEYIEYMESHTSTESIPMLPCRPWIERQRHSAHKIF